MQRPPLPLYIVTSALQLLFVWFVRKGIRAFGHSLGKLLGRTWTKPLDAFRDVVIAALFFLGLNLCTIALSRAFGAVPEAPKFLLPHTAIEIAGSIVLSLLYQGWRATLIIFFYALAFGILAAWRKSILPGMIAHSAIDIVGGLASR